MGGFAIFSGKNDFLQFRILRKDAKQKDMLVKDEALASTVAGMDIVK